MDAAIVTIPLTYSATTTNANLKMTNQPGYTFANAFNGCSDGYFPIDGILLGNSYSASPVTSSAGDTIQGLLKANFVCWESPPSDPDAHCAANCYHWTTSTCCRLPRLAPSARSVVAGMGGRVRLQPFIVALTCGACCVQKHRTAPPSAEPATPATTSVSRRRSTRSSSAPSHSTRAKRHRWS